MALHCKIAAILREVGQEGGAKASVGTMWKEAEALQAGGGGRAWESPSHVSGWSFLSRSLCMNGYKQTIFRLPIVFILLCIIFPYVNTPILNGHCVKDTKMHL